MDIDNAGSLRQSSPSPLALARWPTVPRLAAATEIARPPKAVIAANANRVSLCGLHQRGSNAQWNHPPRG
eukprot:361333-Chlamydomonas_euryale.AAC.3